MEERELVTEEGVDKGGYGRGCEIRYKVGKMADNLPLDYSCPHPCLPPTPGDSNRPLSPAAPLPPLLAYVPGNRCSSFTTDAETLNARAKAYTVLLYLAAVPSAVPPAFLSRNAREDEGARARALVGEAVGGV